MEVTVLCYLWSDPNFKHNAAHRYGIRDVLGLREMVRRHLSLPHRFVCATDHPDQFEGTGVEAVPLVRDSHVPGMLSNKLVTWHPDAAALFGGSRLFVLDLDTVIVRSIDHIVDRWEPLVVWRNPMRTPWDNPLRMPSRALYNTSVVLLDAGAAPHIWEKRGDAHRHHEDQDLVSMFLGPAIAYWDHTHGIYRTARAQDPHCPGVWSVLPDNAAIVTFPGGGNNPWLPEIQERHPWISEHLPQIR